MSGQPRCLRCGSLLSPGEAFCTGCGQPVTAGRQGGNLLLYGVAAAVGSLGLMVLIAVSVWIYLGRAKPPGATTAAQTGNVASQPTVDKQPEKTQTIAGDEFLGAWYASGAEDPANPMARATISRRGDHLVFMDDDTKSRGEQIPRLDLKPAGRGRLTGTNYEQTGRSCRGEAELTAAGDKLVITVTPLGSDAIVETWIKDKAQPAAAAPTTGASEPMAEPVTDEKALRLVSREPKVQAFAKKLKDSGKKVGIEMVPAEGTLYLVHVYEQVTGQGGEPEHTATFGWYNVDPKTGKVTETTP